MKKVYFDSHCGLEKFALCEDDKLTEYICEPTASGAVIGNVYKGRVTDVLNGMQAAFVDCGLERHCYISVEDMTNGKNQSGDVDIPTDLNLRVGDEIMVQVTKAPQGKKGAKVTTQISLVGKYVVFMPTTPFIGVSAKITDSELKKNLLFSAKKQVIKDEGIIVRTAAPYAPLSEKKREIEYLRAAYKHIKERFDNAKVGELIFSDSPLYIRVLRDIMLSAGDEIYVGDQKLYESVKTILKPYARSERLKVIYHDPHTDLFYSAGVTQQFWKTLQPIAELDNGAHIVIDRTEALTVIDVNTGKFTGDDSLEHTVYCTNVLATKEIARQVKLRNLGGLFVVDFIDMTEEKHRTAIVEELEKALKSDGARCKVLPMSKFGLVEFTRKRTGISSNQYALRECKVCQGSGSVRTENSILGEFRARLLEVLADGANTVCADINFGIANLLVADETLKEDIKSLYPEARVYIISHRTYRDDAMYFRKISGDKFTLPEGTVLLY